MSDNKKAVGGPVYSNHRISLVSTYCKGYVLFDFTHVGHATIPPAIVSISVGQRLCLRGSN